MRKSYILFVMKLTTTNTNQHTHTKMTATSIVRQEVIEISPSNKNCRFAAIAYCGTKGKIRSAHIVPVSKEKMDHITNIALKQMFA